MSWNTETDTDDAIIDALRDPATTVSLPLAGLRTLSPRLDLAERVLPCHLVWLVMESACGAILAAKEYRMQPGTIFWVPAGIPNSMHAIAGFPAVTIYFVRIEIQAAIPNEANAEPLVSHQRWDLRALIELLYDQYQVRGGWWQDRVKSVLLLLRSGLHQRSHTVHGPGLSSVQRQKVLQYACQHADVRLKPSDIAAHLRLNQDYFSRLFKQTFGQTARSWLVAQRIRAAAAQLADTRSGVSEIAYALGYQNIHLFNRQFRNMMGMSPTAYRRRAAATTRAPQPPIGHRLSR